MTPAEHAIEMRDIAEARVEGDVHDRQVAAAGIGQQREGALEPAFENVLGERLSRLLEQTLDVSPRHAYGAGYRC
jgi:hypothetical protein